jgi:G3E family GTPase
MGLIPVTILTGFLGIDKRVVFQGVHMLMGSDAGSAWKAGEKRESKMVFIGRDMPKEMLLDGLAHCAARSG